MVPLKEDIRAHDIQNERINAMYDWMPGQSSHHFGSLRNVKLHVTTQVFRCRSIPDSGLLNRSERKANATSVTFLRRLYFCDCSPAAARNVAVNRGSIVLNDIIRPVFPFSVLTLRWRGFRFIVFIRDTCCF